MNTLRFTTGVLGPKAAARLRERSVVQTIRSHSYPPGLYTVDLDGEALGQVSPVSVREMTIAWLTEEDAHLGGFSTLLELLKALRRAGWRFRRKEAYVVWAIRFEWC